MEDKNGWTGFHLACNYGNLKIVQMLVEKSFDLNINLNTKYHNEKTAFHLACEKSHSDIVHYLLQYSNHYRINVDGWADLYGSGKNGQVKKVEMLVQVKNLN